MESAFAISTAAAEHRGEAASLPRPPLLLSLDVRTASGLRKHPLLLQAARRPGVTRRMRRRFFDTADLACGARGFAVGVLEIGGRRRQIVRDLRDPGAAAPAHGDAPLNGDRPDPEIIASIVPELREVLSDAEVREVFAVDGRRTVWSLDLEGARCILALDVGRLAAPDASAGAILAEFADAALLLESGAPAPLYRFVRDLGATLPFTIETWPVERRGYALLRCEQVGAHRAEPCPFPADATVAQGFAAVLRAGAQLVHDNLRAARAGRPEGVHQLRVALRRLRSIIDVFAPVLPESERRAFAGLLKDAAQRLAKARALDVFLGATVTDMRRALPDEDSLRRLETAAKAVRAASYAEIAAEAVPTPALLALAAWADGEIWRDDGEERRAALDASLIEFARDVLRRRHRRLRRRVGGHEEPTIETLHDLRIEAKKARYAVEAFRPLFKPKPVRRYLAGLETLQDVLGAVNDASTAREIAASLALPGKAARAHDLVAGWAACEIEHGRRAFAAAWRGFRRAEPFWHG